MSSKAYASGFFALYELMRGCSFSQLEKTRATAFEPVQTTLPLLKIQNQKIGHDIEQETKLALKNT